MKYKLVIILFFITQLSYAQSIITLISKSDDFFNTLEQGKFELAQDFFDESIKGEATPEVLKNLWVGITSQFGAFRTIDNAQSKVQGEFYMVGLDCKFVGGSQTFMLTYTKAEKLIGFSVIPKSAGLSYTDPVYSDSTLYKQQYITVKSNGHELAGMLTTPKTGTNFPIVILLHGSGAGDMDESIGLNKPFRDLALGLASKGIATLRYVKRTRVYPQEFTKAFTVKEEITDDALAVIAMAGTIPGADKKQIYLFGQGLGGMLAPKLAALAPSINGIILAAAPARKLTDLILEQNKYIYQYSKDTSAAAKKEYELNVGEIEKTRLLKLGAIAPDSLLLGAPASYWIDMNLYDPLAAVKKLKNRILIVQGERDFQTSVQDYSLWKSALSLNTSAVFKIYPDLNHFFIGQTEKGDASQYQKAGNISAYFVDDIALWIKSKP